MSAEDHIQTKPNKTKKKKKKKKKTKSTTEALAVCPNFFPTETIHAAVSVMETKAMGQGLSTSKLIPKGAVIMESTSLLGFFYPSRKPIRNIDYRAVWFKFKTNDMQELIDQVLARTSPTSLALSASFRKETSDWLKDLDLMDLFSRFRTEEKEKYHNNPNEFIDATLEELVNFTHRCALRALDLGFARAVYLTGSLINHSCSPNCRATYSCQGKQKIIALRDIQEGEECFVSYLDIPGLEHQVTTQDQTRQVLRELYGFDCVCNLCLKNENG